MFKVMEKQCDQCLMSKNRIVSAARAKQIVRGTLRDDCHFQCHKGTIAGVDVACRGYFDAYGGGQLGRIAGRLGMIQFVNLDAKESTHA